MPVRHMRMIGPFTATRAFRTVFSAGASTDLIAIFAVFRPALPTASPALSVDRSAPPEPTIEVPTTESEPPGTYTTIFGTYKTLSPVASATIYDTVTITLVTAATRETKLGGTTVTIATAPGRPGA